MSISIRMANANDAELIYSMIYELAEYERETAAVKITPADLVRELNSPQPPFECIIAEIDERPAGFALFFHTYSTWEGTQTLYLEDLFVRTAYRKTGMGAALMQFLSKLARERGCKRFEWSVLNWNEMAIDFYERIGAKPVAGWTRYRLEGDALDLKKAMAS